MSERQSIMWPGFAHSNPIPNASRIGNIVMSSVIGPRDPVSGSVPDSLDAQVTNLFLQLADLAQADDLGPEGVRFVHVAHVQHQVIEAGWGHRAVLLLGHVWFSSVWWVRGCPCRVARIAPSVKT